MRKLFLQCAVTLLLIAPAMYSQGQAPPVSAQGQTQAQTVAPLPHISQEQVDEVIRHVKSGDFDPMELLLLVQSGAPEGVPILKEQFTVSTTPIHIRVIVASYLVRIGERDPVYWDFLFTKAKDVAESDAPDPKQYDSEGKAVPGQLSPEFVEWANAHGLSPNDAAVAQTYELPGILLLLAKTGDLRGLGLLRRGLASRNYLTETMAAYGLAILRDRESIPLIIEACRKAPKDAAFAIAWALVFFDDPKAQTAAEEFIANKQLLEELRKMIREKGIDGIL
jgi:hypothetical protein